MIRAFPLLAALLLFSPPHSAGAPAAASGDEPDIVLKKGADDLSRADEETLGTHRVREGETISGILTSAGVPLSKIEELLQLNPGLSDPDTIYPGQELILPSPADLPAEPPAFTGPSTLGELRSRGDLVPLLARSLEQIGEPLSVSGVLSLPYSAGSAVSIDNSAYPLLQASSGRELILDFGSRMPEEWKGFIHERWPDYEVIAAPLHWDFSRLLDKILSSSGFHSVTRKEPVSIGRDSSVRIVPDFLLLKRPESLLEGDLYIINVLDAPGEALPGEIRDLAREHRITVVEILPVPRGGKAFEGGLPVPFRPSRKITASDTRALLGEVFALMGLDAREQFVYRFAEGDDPGLLLEVKADLFVEGDDRSVLVSFRDIAPRIRRALERRDVVSLVFDDGDPLPHVLGRVLSSFGFSYSGPAVEFFRPDDRFSISVPGFYFLVRGRPTLLTAEALSPRIASLLAGSGIDVVACVVR
jgi:LysM repeat protein